MHDLRKEYRSVGVSMLCSGKNDSFFFHSYYNMDDGGAGADTKLFVTHGHKDWTNIAFSQLSTKN